MRYAAAFLYMPAIAEQSASRGAAVGCFPFKMHSLPARPGLHRWRTLSQTCAKTLRQQALHRLATRSGRSATSGSSTLPEAPLDVFADPCALERLLGA